jgi:hypothetical protein
MINNYSFNIYRSIPKLLNRDDDRPNHQNEYRGVTHFEPIPHDHDFCERIVINVSMNFMLLYYYKI